MKKIKSIIILGLATLVFATQPILASEIEDKQNNLSIESTIEPRFGVNITTYHKENVKYSYEWSPIRRVSDNINTHNTGGLPASISSNKTTTFSRTISGDVYGISFGANKTVSSGLNYTMPVPANTRAYLGYRVKYKVEKGKRVVKGGTLGNTVYRKNSYLVKTPLYGEYILVRQ